MLARSSAVVFLCASVVLARPAPAHAESQGASGPVLDDPTLIALAVALAVSPAPQVVAAPPGPSSPGEPVLELVATVRAKSLVFDEVPRLHVTFSGRGPQTTVWKTERVNLPAQPSPGVVYHDVVVRLTLAATPDELSNLLIDARHAANGVKVEADDASTPAATPAAVASDRRETTPAIPDPPVAPIVPSAPVAPSAPAPVATPAPAAAPAPSAPAGVPSASAVYPLLPPAPSGAAPSAR